MNFASKIFEICKSSLKEDIVVLCRNNASTETYYKLARYFAPQKDILYFPAWDTIPYDRISPSKNILSLRSKALSVLASKEDKKIIFTSPMGLVQKLPESKLFKDKYLQIKNGQNFSIEDISHYLVKSGFVRSATAIDSGEFAVRGEIFDIVISKDEAYRISFEWDKIHRIKKLEPLSQISTEKVGSFEIYPTSEMMLSDEVAEYFKGQFLKYFSVNKADYPIYEAILEKKIISGAEQLLPLCHENMLSLLDYLDSPKILYSDMEIKALEEETEEIKDLYESRILANKINPDNFYPAYPIDEFYFAYQDVRDRISENKLDLTKEYKDSPNFYIESQKTGRSVGALAKKNLSEYSKIHIFCPARSIENRIKQLLELENISIRNINFVNTTLPNGLIANKEAYFKHQDFIGERRLHEKSSSKKLKNILSELDNFKKGDLVVHESHGIGRFIAVENVTAGSIRHDFIKLIYDGGDKLYIPVENIDLIKKYGSDEANLDKLGGISWQKRKSKLKNRIGELAKKLIAMAAMRKTMKIEPIDVRCEEYESFCKKFPYSETEDQLTSIEHIESDFSLPYPMDRMICGDVGFGKTEVAMRAAFLVANAGKQVAIISPTTILARQHQISFYERFRGTEFKITCLSRLTPRKDQPKIIESIKSGEANIVIGTHALLSDSIKFKNLGMIIIDEEQHFGVIQKEKLKELKSEIHVLSLSATPIPRSLQMSVLGIKDLSLIATPPIDRLPVRTTIIPNDTIIIRDALLRESTRGGRSFYVVPRISDIEDIEKQLKSSVPELKYAVAHGKMNSSSIDKIMSDFYEGRYDILLCTTIIESGIDIPAANTIIIHRAEMLGLSQLYQLRGRVGRSRVRGYAYLVASNIKHITNSANKRLEIMENIDSLGAGFTIASYDSDIRGFGNLVGDEQSGHIKEVGAELYQEMLEEAISEIQEQKSNKIFSPNINIEIPVFIPNEYIEDSEMRMGIYKRISALAGDSEIEQFKDELIDRFGDIPQPTNNLLALVKLKYICRELKIIQLDSGPNGILLKFLEDELVSKMVMAFIAKNPGIVKLRPDNKLVILKQFKKDKILAGILELLDNIKNLD